MRAQAHVIERPRVNRSEFFITIEHMCIVIGFFNVLRAASSELSPLLKKLSVLVFFTTLVLPILMKRKTFGVTNLGRTGKYYTIKRGWLSTRSEFHAFH